MQEKMVETLETHLVLRIISVKRNWSYTFLNVKRDKFTSFCVKNPRNRYLLYLLKNTSKISGKTKDSS